MSDLDIRRFEDGDGPTVRRLHEVALRDAGDFADGVPEPDLQDVPAHYLDGDGEFLVGTVADEVVAMVALHSASEWILADRFDFDRPTGELTRLRVLPDHQRQGHARTLCRELEDRARDIGYEQLVLDVSADNEVARAFYESMDYEYLDAVEPEALGRTFPLAVYRTSLTDR